MGLCLVVLCTFVFCIAYSLQTPCSSLSFFLFFFFFINNLPEGEIVRQIDRQTDRRMHVCKENSLHKRERMVNNHGDLIINILFFSSYRLFLVSQVEQVTL